MWSCETHSGRLIEIRIQGSMKLEELVQLRDHYVALLGKLPGRAVVLTDVRKVQLFQSEASDKLIAMMAALNPRIERSAILLSESALVRLQATRVVEESGQEVRRLFDDAGNVCDWLGEVLSGEELSRARLFLAEGCSPSPGSPPTPARTTRHHCTVSRSLLIFEHRMNVGRWSVWRPSAEPFSKARIG